MKKNLSRTFYSTVKKIAVIGGISIAISSCAYTTDEELRFELNTLSKKACESFKTKIELERKQELEKCTKDRDNSWYRANRDKGALGTEGLKLRYSKIVKKYNSCVASKNNTADEAILKQCSSYVKELPKPLEKGKENIFQLNN